MFRNADSLRRRPNSPKVKGALLRDCGCEVATCKDGREALTQLAGDPYDLLVAAIYMPRMDGLELIRAVHEQFPRLPVIALSPSFFDIDDVYLRNARLFGAIEGFTQPVRPEIFLAGVARCLRPNLGGK